MQCRSTRTIFQKLDTCPVCPEATAQQVEDKESGSVNALKKTFNAFSKKLSSISKWICREDSAISSYSSFGYTHCKSWFSNSLSIIQKNAKNFLTSYNFWDQLDQARQVIADICADPEKFTNQYMYNDLFGYQILDSVLLSMSVVAAIIDNPFFPSMIGLGVLRSMYKTSESYWKDLAYLTDTCRSSMPQFVEELEELISEGICLLPIREAIIGGALGMVLEELPALTPPKFGGALA